MNNVGTVMQWVNLIVMGIGLLTILVRVGNTQGRQLEKNSQFEESLKNQQKKINTIESDISAIRSDVSYIKGKLENK